MFSLALGKRQIGRFSLTQIPSISTDAFSFFRSTVYLLPFLSILFFLTGPQKLEVSFHFLRHSEIPSIPKLQPSFL